jgi:phage terminase large subunit
MEITQKNEFIEIDFNPDSFNEIYFHLEEAYNNPNIRFIWIYGGSSASKSHSASQLIVRRKLYLENENTLLLRKYATDIRDSIYSDFEGIISDWELNDFYLLQQNYIECTATGSYTRFRGLDDSEKVKGISNFKRVVMEEVSQFTLKDFKQVRKRLRGKEGQQIVGIFNPIDENHWIKQDIFDKDEWIEIKSNITGKWINKKGNSIILKVTYLDNKYIVGPNFVDKHTIEDFEDDKLKDPDNYKIYALGEWGVHDKSKKFAYAFDESKHVGKVEFNENEYTYLSFDFNMNPITCAVIQHYNGTIHVVEQIKLNNSNIYALCDHIKAKYTKSMFIVTGDETGKNSNALVQDNLNHYKVIKQSLGISDAQVQIPSKNPPIVENKVLVNALLQGYNIIIDRDNAQLLIYDMKYVEVSADNKLEKDRTTDMKKSDALDCFRYYCNKFHKNFLKMPKHN